MFADKVFLITGACGFFGSHLLEHLIKNTHVSARFILIDNLNYSGTLDRIRDIKIAVGGEWPYIYNPLDSARVKFFNWDFRLAAEPNFVSELQDVTHIIHAGGMTHVDSSISDPMSFVIGNVVGTTNVLELARKLPNLELFHFCNTDEVFGAADLPYIAENPHNPGEIIEIVRSNGFKENDTHTPGNPYSATKSAAFQMVQAYANTYMLPCISTNLMNLIGERQHHEKFIPKVIRSVMTGDLIFIHASADKKQPGRRTYIHARNASAAFTFLYDKKPWLSKSVRKVETYNICGEQELDNLQVARMLEKMVQREFGMSNLKLNYELVDFHSSRPGHDLRYALDGSKMKSLGWCPPKTIEESLRNITKWSLSNKRWLNLKEF